MSQSRLGRAVTALHSKPHPNRYYYHFYLFFLNFYDVYSVEITIKKKK